MDGVAELDEEIARLQRERSKRDKGLVTFGGQGDFDTDLYGSSTDKASLYRSSIPSSSSSFSTDTFDNDDEEDEEGEGFGRRKLRTFTAPSHLLSDALPDDEAEGGNHDDVFRQKAKSIASREDDYKQRRFNRVLSPDRANMYADKTPAPDLRTYKDALVDTHLEKEEAVVRANIEKKMKEQQKESSKEKRKRTRWDVDSAKSDSSDTASSPPGKIARKEEKATFTSDWDDDSSSSSSISVKKESRWDAPTEADATPQSRWDEATPTKRKRNRWDETPANVDGGATPTGGWGATPQIGAGGGATPKKSRWDETPAAAGSLTPGATPFGDFGAMTPGTVYHAAMTPEQVHAMRWEREVDERNRPFTDEELDAMIPTGYKIVNPPDSYVPIRTQARKLTATPTPLVSDGFQMTTDVPASHYGIQLKTTDPDLPDLKPEDEVFFKKLLDGQDETEMSKEERKEREIMKLLLKVKNGTPPQRKVSLRQLTDQAREFGPGPLFNQILPLLMSPTLEDQERHLLVKVIDRVLYKLDELVRPFVHKILVVIEPLLIDEDYYARVEGREIISNLSKAAGLATMIATMRPDIDNVDEYVRNTTARAFSVVASALGIPALLPFLKAVCQSKKSWQARHTGIKIVQQIAILMGCAVLPHLKQLVEIIGHGLEDEQAKVRTITALALSALAEAAAPYGIESFDSVLKPLWYGMRKHRGKGLASFLKAIGYIIPLMDAEYASYYTKEVMPVLKREFQSPDEEMKKIVLKVVKQCVATEGVSTEYVKADILPDFFGYFWVRRMALDRRNYAQLVETTVELAAKVGSLEIINRIADDLKDESEPFRRMVMETIDKVMQNLGSSDIDQRLEERLIDGILYAFQEQATDDNQVLLNGFGTVVNALGFRVKPYLPQICGIIKFRLNNRSSKTRQQAADLISRIAVVMKQCGEEQLLGRLGIILYEYLGEEYPDVLGSILAALKAIVNVVGMDSMTPPIKELLPRLTPILKNRHEKVQENCIDLVGRIADRGAEHVSAREWMRICFDLLDMLKAHKKGIRRATVNTFGYIAKAIGPQDVLATLLNNLKVQERQNRVCTTVAIAIVAETCSPFTVLPALMNEYRIPEMNVQNGVLKSLSFLFEYIGEMGKDYIYAVTPLLEDALMDRDLVHRQTACTVVKHMALGVHGLSCEDAMIHLLNFVWPNIFESSPHVINAVMEAIEGMILALGPAYIMNYTLQVSNLFSFSLFFSLLSIFMWICFVGCCNEFFFLSFFHFLPLFFRFTPPFLFLTFPLSSSPISFLFSRASSTQQGRCERCTGRSTTPSTLPNKMPLSCATHSWRMRERTLIGERNWNSLYERERERG